MSCSYLAIAPMQRQHCDRGWRANKGWCCQHFNPVQLSVLCANVDIQYCYLTKRSLNTVQSMQLNVNLNCFQSMKEIFAKIVRSLKDDNTSLKAVQKLLINSVGERDYSAQETCQVTPGFVLLRQLPYKLQQFGHISGLSHFQSSISMQF